MSHTDIRSLPICDWCGECECCPQHECEGCLKGVETPVEYLERLYPMLDRRIYWEDFPHRDMPGTRFCVSGMGGPGMLFSLKTDDYPAYWREIYRYEIPNGDPRGSDDYPHP